MKSFARLEDNIVKERLNVDNLPPFHPSLTWVECSSNVNTGWRYDGNVFLEPEEPPVVVPAVISPRQGYIILSRYGLLLPVQSYFAALEGQEGEEARIELEYAQEWRRDWTTLTDAATAFGLTTEQIDQMFIEAAGL